MKYPVRMLHVFARMDRGGAETMIMNLYRNIDRSKIQFDFVVHTEKNCAFDDEILKMGGKIFRIPRYNGKNHYQYLKAWRDFFNKNIAYRKLLIINPYFKAIYYLLYLILLVLFLLR